MAQSLSIKGYQQLSCIRVKVLNMKIIFFYASSFIIFFAFSQSVFAGEHGVHGSTNEVSSNSSGSGSFNQKYSDRKAERFDLISYLTNQKKIISAQNAKYGNTTSSGFQIHPDLVLTYMSESASLNRDDGSNLGKAQTSLARVQFLANDFVSQGGPRRSINIDVGLELYSLQTQQFTVDASSTQSQFKLAETGAALIFRPFGRSSQDTGLLLKAGYMSLNETGLWATANNNAVSLGSLYYGAEFKLYLLSFLGSQVEFTTTPSQDSSAIGGSWQSSRWRYGGFVEFHLLALGALITESSYKLTQASAQVTDTDKGISFFASMFF